MLFERLTLGVYPLKVSVCWQCGNVVKTAHAAAHAFRYGMELKHGMQICRYLNVAHDPLVLAATAVHFTHNQQILHLKVPYCLTQSTRHILTWQLGLKQAWQCTTLYTD